MGGVVVRGRGAGRPATKVGALIDSGQYKTIESF